MGAREEAAALSFLDCLAAHDLAAILDHYSDEATYHVNGWHQPIVGREAIRAELDRRYKRVTHYSYTILNIASTDAVVFIEAVDEFMFGDQEIRAHWSGVREFNKAGKITAHRDYWDSREYETPTP